MILVPWVSAMEIQDIVRERLAAELPGDTDDWQKYSALDSSACRHEEWWLVLGFRAAKCSLLHTLISKVKDNIIDVHDGVV